MAKTIIFMNQHLLDKKSKEPKITIQHEDGRRIHCNTVHIQDGFVMTGTLDVGTHVLKAWVETESWRVIG